MMRAWSLRWVVVLLMAVSVRADVVHLKDGSKVEGKVRRDGDGWIINNSGSVVRVTSDQVESIELIATTNRSAVITQVRLESLRHSLENLSDLTDIVARVQRFVDRNADDAEAKKDLALWKDRQTRGMVKVGSAWVLPVERDRLLEQAQQKVETARQLMKQGRSTEADALLTDALRVDPQNPSAQFLNGLLRAQQDQLATASRAFEAVSEKVPNHGPTLNNLAILQWRQRQYLSAMTHFDQAMLSRPVDQMILANVEGAIALLPVEFQNAPVVVKAIEHFQEQQSVLSDRMARAGLHRVGALWLTDKQLQQSRMDEQQIASSLDRLSAEFDRTRARVQQIDQTIADDASANAAGFFRVNGDATELQSERNAALARLDWIKKQAQELEASRPGNRKRGIWLMFSAEAAPMRIASMTGN